MGKLTQAELALIEHYGWDLRLEKILEMTITYQTKLRELQDVRDEILEMEALVASAEKLSESMAQRESLIATAEQQLHEAKTKDNDLTKELPEYSDRFYDSAGQEAALLLVVAIEEAEYKTSREQIKMVLQNAVAQAA